MSQIKSLKKTKQIEVDRNSTKLKINSFIKRESVCRREEYIEILKKSSTKQCKGPSHE